MFIDLKREKRGGEGGIGREKENINLREKHPLVTSHMHPDYRLNPKPRYVL